MWVSWLLKHTVEPYQSVKFRIGMQNLFEHHFDFHDGNSFQARDMNIRNVRMKKIIVKKRHSIRKSQAQDLLARLYDQIGNSARFFHADMIEVIETNADVSLFMVNRKLLLMDTGDWVFPTLKGAIQFPFPERRIIVDAGAIPYVVNGADVMRPGIVSVTDDIKSISPVQIVDERHGKPLAIGVALLDAPDIRASTSGKMCKNFHHVSDEIWNIEI